MKSKKVLIGLIVAAFVGGAGVASAQTKANYQNNLIEIGPDNIGGRVRSIVVDEADQTHKTLYAGGVVGGLYKKSGSDYWQYIPYYNNNLEITLPITHIVQLKDNTLLIATGEGFIGNHGVNNDRMSPKGRGVYHFDPNTNQFELLTKTNPDGYTDWTYVNRLATLERDNFLFIYAATNNGLYRWKLNASNPDWTENPTKVVDGMFHDVIIISADNIAYATGPGKMYRIGNVTGESAAIDITSSIASLAYSGRTELAANTEHKLDTITGQYTHKTYLYAVVVDTNGLLDAVYLTNNQQTWTRLTTSTIVPFSSDNPGTLNASVAINPRNYKSIYVGGSNVFRGEGFVENAYYQWTNLTYSENDLNAGNYMASVYSSPFFVHSGIHQILPTWEVNNEADTAWVIYFATDGGIYKQDTTGAYVSLNKGFNTVQYNDIAVAPDASIIGGAVDNGCPFIQARDAHYGSVPTNSWYDNDTASIMNHMANVLWFGNGGGVDASMFQQLLPLTRRSIFVSAEPGRLSYTYERGGATEVGYSASFGRACNDYADYTNTQTWTIGEAFLSNLVVSSNPIPQIKLWETTNNTIWKDSITFNLDFKLGALQDSTFSYFIHNGVATTLDSNTVVVPGDKILVASKPTFSYPFYHTFTETFTAKDRISHTVHNPVISRAIVNGRNGNISAVYMNTTPNYYRNVWNYADNTSTDPNVQTKLMNWDKIYQAKENYSIGDIAFSRDGRSVYINVILDSTGESFIFRLYDYNNADINNIMTMHAQLGWQEDRPDYPENPRITHYDTIFAPDGGWFKRPVTSIAVDPRNGQDNLILTFGGYEILEPNMVYIANAGNPATRTVTAMSISDATSGMATSDPIYSALIECTTGAVYAGTEKGVFVSASAINPVWQSYGSFNGVPVTSIVQQTKAMPRVSYKAYDGANLETYLFAKTKYPYAIYFGTYGRGIFMDSTYVVDHVAEVCDSTDWGLLGINNVDNGENHMSIFPNPVVDNATVELSVVNAGYAVVKIYDINGKLVHSENLGYIGEGVHRYSLDCTKFRHGMYLVNINLGKESATSKLIVR